MALLINIFVTAIILGLVSGHCSFPSFTLGEWSGNWANTNVTEHNWGKYTCVGIHHYEDEPDANTILMKDPVGIERPYYTIYCYYCLFVRKENSDKLKAQFRHTICSRHGDPGVDYACRVAKPASRYLTTYNRV